MIKNRMMQLTEDLYDDLDDDMEMVVPILTECETIISLVSMFTISIFSSNIFNLTSNPG